MKIALLGLGLTVLASAPFAVFLGLESVIDKIKYLGRVLMLPARVDRLEVRVSNATEVAVEARRKARQAERRATGVHATDVAAGLSEDE